MPVIPFVKVDSPVEVLERALERARAGEYSSVNVAWVSKDCKTVGGIQSISKNCFMSYAAIKYSERHYAEVAFGEPIKGKYVRN